MFQNAAVHAFSSGSGAVAADHTRYPTNATVMAIGCLRQVKTLGSSLKVIGTFMTTVTDGSVTSWSSGLVYYYNVNKTHLPDSDTITIVMGKISFMDPDGFGLEIPKDEEHHAYKNLSDYDFFMEAEKIFPLTPATTPPTSFTPFQAPTIIFGGVANNCVRNKPFSFTCDIELYMSTWKRPGPKPYIAVKCIFSPNGPYKSTEKPPMPWNKKCVMVTGTIVSIEYDRTRTRANGVPMITRYVVDVIHISFMGSMGDSKSSGPFPNTLDANANQAITAFPGTPSAGGSSGGFPAVAVSAPSSTGTGGGFPAVGSSFGMPPTQPSQFAAPATVSGFPPVNPVPQPPQSTQAPFATPGVFSGLHGLEPPPAQQTMVPATPSAYQTLHSQPGTQPQPAAPLPAQGIFGLHRLQAPTTQTTEQHAPTYGHQSYVQTAQHGLGPQQPAATPSQVLLGTHHGYHPSPTATTPQPLAYHTPPTIPQPPSEAQDDLPLEYMDPSASSSTSDSTNSTESLISAKALGKRREVATGSAEAEPPKRARTTTNKPFTRANAGGSSANAGTSANPA